LLAITDNGNVTAWNYRSGDCVFAIENPISKLKSELRNFSLVDAFVYSNDSIYLVLTDDAGSMQIVHWNQLQCKFHLIASLGGNGGVIRCLTWDNVRQTLVIGSESGTVSSYRFLLEQNEAKKTKKN